MSRLLAKFFGLNNDATKIGDGSVTTSEFQFINTLTSNAQTQIDGKASTTLNNLGTTAVNADLTRGTPGTAWTIGTSNNGAGASGGLTISTGTATTTRGSVTTAATSHIFNVSNMQPIAANTVSIGTAAVFFRETNIKDIFTFTAAGVDSTWLRGTTGSSPSATSVDGYLQKANNSATPLAIFTPNKAGTGVSMNILIETGNSTAGAFNSGDISLRTGTSSGASPGAIKLLRAGIPAVIGDVWTATATDGTGYWAAPASGGANTTLSNLGVTSINAALIPAANNTQDLGTTAKTWADIYGRNFIYRNGSNQVLFGNGTTPSGVSAVSIWNDTGGTAQNLAVYTRDSAVASATTAKVNIETGNSTGTTANSGDITLKSGTATADRGNLVIDTRKIVVPATITTGGTTGAQTIDKISGTVNFAAAATSLVVTNSTVTANSIVLAVIRTNDSTMTSVQVVPAAGSFTIFANAAATAETSVGFLVVS